MTSDDTPAKPACTDDLPDITPKQLLVMEKLERTKHVRKRPVILVVEDQAFSRKLLFNMLIGISETYLAADAHEGWQCYLDNYPDIVFLDIELNGLDGHALAKRIKRTAPDTFIAMVTGNNSIDDINAAKSNRVDGYIVKPYSKQKILQCIEKYQAIKKAIYSSGGKK
ncbi:MAG: response regulator [Alphaproteobacteria bacterium]|nr:response regulator [Alphaproteobacteria bacterium]